MKRKSRPFLFAKRGRNNVPIPIVGFRRRCSTVPGRAIPYAFRAKITPGLEKLRIGGALVIRPIRYPAGMTPRQRRRWVTVRRAIAVWGQADLPLRGEMLSRWAIREWEVRDE